jgi:hypothetical protein
MAPPARVARAGAPVAMRAARMREVTQTRAVVPM